MINLGIKIDRSFFRTKEALEIFLMRGLPNVEKAVSKALNEVRLEWGKEAHSAFRHTSGNYIQNIHVNYPLTTRMHGAVTNTCKYADALERGVTADERRQILFTSHQVRVSKKGFRYLVIPFKHGTPGAITMRPMPADIYKQAKELSFSVPTGSYYEISKQLAGASRKDIDLIKQFGSPSTMAKPRGTLANNIPLAARFQTMWGKRLTGVGGIHEGMVRMGNKRNTEYMTFRVMSEVGKPWRGTKPLKIMAKTASKMKPHVQGIIRTGLNQDILDMQEIIRKARM
jgi:hypothetical protein